MVLFSLWSFNQSEVGKKKDVVIITIMINLVIKITLTLTKIIIIMIIIITINDLKLYSRSEKGLDSLVQTVRVFSEDIGMEFGIEKCPMLVMETGKIVKSVGIELPNSKVIKSLQEG